MKKLLVLLVLTACGGKPAAPDAKQFAAMTPDQKCDATAERGAQCADEMMLATLHALNDGDPAMKELETQLQKEVDDAPASSHDQALKMHRTTCAGDDGYADAVFACWATDPCKAFADCVMKTSTAAAKAKPKPPNKVLEPLDLDAK